MAGKRRVREVPLTGEDGDETNKGTRHRRNGSMVKRVAAGMLLFGGLFCAIVLLNGKKQDVHGLDRYAMHVCVCVYGAHMHIHEAGCAWFE
jgi:hypothetical protein